MNPYTKLRYTLLAALLIWLPVAAGMFTSGVELWFAGAAFLGALAIGWLGVGIVAHISDGYARTGRQLDVAKRQIEAIERRKQQQQQHPQRRKDDVVDEEDTED